MFMVITFNTFKEVQVEFDDVCEAHRFALDMAKIGYKFKIICDATSAELMRNY